MSMFIICQLQDRRRTVQDFTSLFAYMNQLQVPLHSLGASVQDFLKAVVNSERLTMTLKEESAMGDIVGARQMIECAADIEFDSVTASSLESLTFRCEKETIAVIQGVLNSGRPPLTTPCSYHPLGRHHQGWGNRYSRIHR
jgi:ABC-type transport system involved in Fe-S cluster assembly fused permease/ATPase subunit